MKTRTMRGQQPIESEMYSHYGSGGGYTPGYMMDYASPGGGPAGPSPQYGPSPGSYNPNSPIRAAQRGGLLGASVGQRGVTPYQSRGILGYVPPSQGDGPYGGQPLSRQGGQLTDYGAGQMNRASRDYLGDQNYMPRTTVGGAYGQSPDTDYRQAQGRRNANYRLSQGSGSDYNRLVADSNRRGILGAVAHSSYGATSGTVIDSTGRPRPGWVDNYSGSTGAVGQQDVQRGLDAVYNQGGRVVGPNGRMSLSPGSQQYDATQRAGEAFDARRGGLQARIADYEARTAEAKQFREGNRIARGMQRGQRMTDSLDMRRGNLSMDERFMFGNPQAYARTVEAKNLGAYQQGLLGVQDRATQARERMAGIESGDRRYGIDATAEARKGDREAAGLLAAGQQASNERVAGIQGTNAANVAGVQGQGALSVARENNAGRRDEVAIRREEMAMRRADALRAQSDQAYNSGDIQRGQALEQQANNLEVGIGRGEQTANGLLDAGFDITDPEGNGVSRFDSGGGPAAGGGILGAANSGQAAPQAPMAQPPAPQGIRGASGRVSPRARPAIDKVIAATRGNPQAMVNRLREMGLSDQQINMELSTAFGKSFGGLGEYQRTATSPGGAWFTQVDPGTGEEMPTIGPGYLNPRWWRGGIDFSRPPGR